jgi:hypothetical protein
MIPSGICIRVLYGVAKSSTGSIGCVTSATASHSSLFRRPSQGASLSLNNIFIPGKNRPLGLMLSNFSGGRSATARMMFGSVMLVSFGVLSVAASEAFTRIPELQNTIRALL